MWPNLGEIFGSRIMPQRRRNHPHGQIQQWPAHFLQSREEYLWLWTSQWHILLIIIASGRRRLVRTYVWMYHIRQSQAIPSCTARLTHIPQTDWPSFIREKEKVTRTQIHDQLLRFRKLSCSHSSSISGQISEKTVGGQCSLETQLYKSFSDSHFWKCKLRRQ